MKLESLDDFKLFERTANAKHLSPTGNRDCFFSENFSKTGIRRVINEANAKTILFQRQAGKHHVFREIFTILTFSRIAIKKI